MGTTIDRSQCPAPDLLLTPATEGNPLSRIHGVLQEIRHPTLTLSWVCMGENWWLRWVDTNARCNLKGDPIVSNGRKWRLSPFMTDGEVVWTAFAALMMYMEHEAREQFKFQGVSVANSHVDIHRLVTLHKSEGGLTVRSPSPSKE